MSIDLRIISQQGERTVSSPMRGIRLGRDVSPSDDLDAICFSEDVVSAHHADIVFEHGPQGMWYYLRPRNSRNPVLLDGHEVVEAEFLTQNSRIQLGRTGPVVEVTAILGQRPFRVVGRNPRLQAYLFPAGVAIAAVFILSSVLICAALF